MVNNKKKKAHPVKLMDEARAELFSLDAVNRAEFISAIDDFELYGPAHAMVDTEKIEGELYELKTQSPTHWLRGFYFHLQDGLYVITHIFAKKTNKTPKANKEIGLTRYKAFKEAMTRAAIVKSKKSGK
ncbi:type II toxin-antitoxin system RelE/ParE family toxin [Pantoea cypripedii]|uniref:Addiction module toxin RelE n=1 Tax=Pantoea cypripedii TaxID=55209 RepID=A0A1X1EY50_PANCY|nr:type II toxin-antitoxin system RelE/ParE family toxin [Pantoea cypripedii]ORM94901.1 hypothetical protein HA50_16745 [Pantoea cypripedii]